MSWRQIKAVMAGVKELNDELDNSNNSSNSIDKNSKFNTEHSRALAGNKEYQDKIANSIKKAKEKNKGKKLKMAELLKFLK